MSGASYEVATIAARAFLASMRRSHLKKYPGQPCLVLNLEDYTGPDQARLILGIQAALAAAQPDNIERVRQQNSSDSIL
jgi:hypothetical protein